MNCCFPWLPVGLLPVASLGVNQVGRLNLGRCVASLQYFTVCGQQEGYQPFAANMARDPALWMSWQQPQFSPIRPDDDDHHVQVRDLHLLSFSNNLSVYFSKFLFFYFLIVVQCSLVFREAS